jgi:hypothetical protein
MASGLFRTTMSPIVEHLASRYLDANATIEKARAVLDRATPATIKVVTQSAVRMVRLFG